MDPQSFSIGLRSELSTGDFHQLMSLFTKNLWMYLLVCLDHFPGTVCGHVDTSSSQMTRERLTGCLLTLLQS